MDLDGLASGGLGAGATLLLRELARWVRRQRAPREVVTDADENDGAVGTVGWLWKELLRERGARHALQATVGELRERVARLEGHGVSGEQPSSSSTRAARGSRPG